MKTRILVLITLIFWIAMAGIVVRVNRLWFGPVTFRWSNIHQPSATFRWTTAPVGKTVIIPENSSRSFKVVIPRKFTTGELIIATSTSQGTLTAVINAPAGKTNTIGTVTAGTPLILPLSWDDIAVQTRTFNVELMTDTYPVELKAIRLQIR